MYNYWDKIKAPLEEVRKNVLKNSNDHAYSNSNNNNNNNTSNASPNLTNIAIASPITLNSSTNILKQTSMLQMPSVVIPAPTLLTSTSTLSRSRDINHQLPSSAAMALGSSTVLNVSSVMSPTAAMVSNMGMSMGIPSSLNLATDNIIAVPSQISEIPIISPNLQQNQQNQHNQNNQNNQNQNQQNIFNPTSPLFLNPSNSSVVGGTPSPQLNLPTLATSIALSPSTLKQTTTFTNNNNNINYQQHADHLYPSSIAQSANIPSPSPFKLTSPIMISQHLDQHEVEMMEFNNNNNNNQNQNNNNNNQNLDSSILDGASSINITVNETKSLTSTGNKIKKKHRKDKMKRFKKSVYQILAPSNQLPMHQVDSAELENYVVPFLMELGRALLMSGVPVHRLEYELTLISGTFGIDGNFFSTPTGIFFSFGSPHTILSPYTHLLRIQSTDYNMERLVKLEELADHVIYGRIKCQEALVRLHDILNSPPLYNMYVMVSSFVLSSFAIAFFFQAGWVEIGAMSLVGFYVGLLYAAAGRWPTIGRVLEALSAFGGSIIATFFNSFIYPVHIFLVVLGGIIALAPGLSLTIAVAEISTRNLVSGNARLMGAFSCLLQLTFGIALGTRLSSNFLPTRTELPPASFPEWSMFLAIPLAAVSFAIQMKVHPRQIWIIMLTSILGVIGGNWGNKIFGSDVGSFFGACLICIVSNLYARFTNGQSVVPILSGIILLVPGSMGVKGLFSMSSGNIEAGIALFGGMFMISTSLAIGLLVANLIVPPHKAL